MEHLKQTQLPSLNLDNISFEDLFNLEEIQQIQDEYASATNVASIITFPDGTPITKPSNFCKLCNIIRKTEKGLRYCEHSDSVIGRQHLDGPIIETCLSGGLWDAGISITVGGKHLANWLIGQGRTESADLTKMAAYAKEIGIDMDEFFAAYNEVPIFSSAHFQNISQTLYLIVKQLSDKAYQNLQQAHFIAESKKTKEKLKQTMHSYHDVFNAVSEAIFIQDADTAVIIDVNKSAEIIFGFTREEILGKTPEYFAYPGKNDLDQLAKNAQEVFTSGIADRYEFWAIRKNGEIFPQEVILNKGRYFGKDVLIAAARDMTQQNEADELIKKEKAELSSIVEAGNIYVINTDLNGNYTYFNQHFSDRFKWIFNGNEIIGRNALESILPEDHERTIDIVKTCIQHPNTTHQLELRNPIRNGGIFTTLWEFTCRSDMQGNPNDILCIGIDITAQKKAENELRKSEEKYRALVDNAFEGSLIIDLTGKVLFANQTLIRTFGYENLGEVADRNIFDFFAPESIQQAIEDLTRMVQGETLDVANYCGITKNGNKIWFESIGKIIEYEGAKADIISVRDISTKRKAAEALRESEDKYRTIAENTSDGILILDENRQAQYASPAYLRQLGYPVGESPVLNAEIIFSFIHPEERDSLFNRIYESIEQKKDGLTYAYRAKHQDGYYIWLEDNARFIYDNQGNHLKTYIISRNITERKLTEEKLVENEDKFRAITETANDAIFVSNSSGDIVFCNPKALEVFGYDKSELLNQPYEILLPEQYRLNHQMSFNTFVSENVSHIMGKLREFTAVKKNGSEFPIEISLSNWKTSSGVFISANIRDISERKRAEKINKIQNLITAAALETKDLRELISLVRVQLSTIIDTTNFFIALLNEQTGMLTAPFVSDENDDGNEWPAEKSLTGLVIRRNKAFLLSLHDIEELYKEGEVALIGSPALCWLGVPLHMEGKTTGAFVVQSYTNENAYSDSDLEILEFISHQISMAIQRKNNEQQISLLGKSTEQSPVSIVITNVDGKVEYVNPKFCEVTGYSVEEAIGQNPRLLKSGLHPPEVYTELWTNLKSGRQWFGELHNRRKNGELFWENVSISPLTDLNGDITHFVAVKEDITEKKALFEELVLTKEKAQESDRLKTAFLNNISHEIRTPFNGILGFLSLISAQDISITERDLYIGIINQSADRLINTINDIVEISTIQAGQTKVYIAETNINKLVDKLYYKFDPFAETKGLELIIKKTLSDADCFVKTDETKLLAILNNLINNAIKFTKKGSVEIGYSLHNDILRFYVKDTGIGIPEEKCQSIFERFMQADVSNTRGFEGSGLGLSIAKAYVEMLEGTIWLESKVGIGSKFFLQIPCQTNDDIKPESVAEKPDNLQNSGENLTILFAEDDDINFDFTNVILSRADYKVLRAKTGAEAIQLCRNNPHVSLILMDIKMPGINGYIATKEIRLFNQDIPIIAVTAYAQPGDEQRALDAGCTYYLAKPVRRHELLNLVNSYLKK